MNQPSVTVLMAVLNGENWLPKVMPDLLGQTMNDFELLVVDDGSTDQTQQIIAGYPDPRIRLERLEHVGLAPALNHGISLARGRYIARMDVDDRCTPDRLEKQLLAAARDPDALAIGCTFEVLDQEGARQSVIAPPPLDDDIRRRMLVRNPFAAGSVMFDALALKAVGGYREEFTSAEDYELLVRLAQRGPLTSAPEILYGWRIHAGNMSLRMRERELRTVGLLHDQLWTATPAPRAPRELSDRLDRYHRDIPETGEIVASQVLQTELLITRSMLGRHRWKNGTRQFRTLLVLVPRQWRHLVHGLWGRVSQVIGQRVRARRAAA